jgi:hypothetical protein
VYLQVADGKRTLPATFLQGGLRDVREKSHFDGFGLLSELAWTKNLAANQQMAVVTIVPLIVPNGIDAKMIAPVPIRDLQNIVGCRWF